MFGLEVITLQDVFRTDVARIVQVLVFSWLFSYLSFWQKLGGAYLRHGGKTYEHNPVDDLSPLGHTS